MPDVVGTDPLVRAGPESDFYKKDGFLKTFLMSLSNHGPSHVTEPLQMPPTPPDSATSSEDDGQTSKNNSPTELSIDDAHAQGRSTSGQEVIQRTGKSADTCGRADGGTEGVLIDAGEGPCAPKKERCSPSSESFAADPPAERGVGDSYLVGLREAGLSHPPNNASSDVIQICGANGVRDTSASLCVMQQKVGAPTFGHRSGTAGLHGTVVQADIPSGPSSMPGGGAPRSVLKHPGQRSRGHRVSINEARNEVVEADYVILVHDEEEPQLVSVKSFDLGLNAAAGSGSSIDSVTLSPPEGYKDYFGRAVHETIVDDLDTEAGANLSAEWAIKVHDPDCPRANLPDLVSTGKPQLTVENVRHHDLLMQDNNEGPNDSKVAKTGILKGGKLWKNGKKLRPMVQMEKLEEPRRSVRFSGRDEYTTLETAAILDKLPLDSSNQAAIACLLSPQLHELGMLLRESTKDGWQFELGPLGRDEFDGGISEIVEGSDGGFYRLPCPKHDKLNHHFDDEQISESVQRYDEIRRRIAVAEGRDNNSTCSDESKSSSDSQSSESPNTETKIRRLENADVAHVAGGIIRSNSEVRRAIERNALRRSLMRFAEARKKDTNRNEKNEKPETSLIDKLKWLTASEDVTNANSDNMEGDNEEQPKEIEESKKTPESKPLVTMHQYRRLAEMFNKTTSVRSGDIPVPGDLREWKLNAELFADIEGEELPPGSVTYTAIPAVSICEQLSDEETEKLIYSGGVRYTKEGTLPPGTVNGVIKKYITNGHYSEETDEAIHDDRSSSVASSSQSSPRLSGRSDADGASTAESGYSSNETNSDLGQILHPELDELVEFVKQDAGRIDRLRRRYDESEDHGFSRRPSVRGIKARFGSTSDILSQMASQLASPSAQMGNQLLPPPLLHPTAAGSHLSWPCRELTCTTDSDTVLHRRKLASSRSNPLPALQEDAPFTAGQTSYVHLSNHANAHPYPKSARTATVHSSAEDIRGPAPRPAISRESSAPDAGRAPNHIPPQRAQSLSSLNQSVQLTNHQISCAKHSSVSSGHAEPNAEYHHHTCGVRRPASVHGHAPTDMLVSGPQHPTPQAHMTAIQLPPLRPHFYSHEGIPQDDCMMVGPRGTCQVSRTCRPMYPPHNIMPETKHSSHYVDHHNNFPQGTCGPVIYSHSSQSETNPSQPREFHGSNGSVLMPSVQQRMPDDAHFDEPRCTGWHPHGSSYSHIHVDGHILPPPISSHLSYTTPIVPEDSNPLINGLVPLDNDVPTGRGGIDHFPSHSSPTRESALHMRQTQPMNVST